jgi:ribosome maturation factor RimP
MSGIAQIDIADRARSLLEPVLARDGYELVEVEWTRASGRWTLRLFIDRQGGVGIEDCQGVSRTVEPILDVEDFVDAAYDLEVSSPGLDRPLRKPEHFARYAGQRVVVKAFGPVPDTAPGSPGRKSWTGVLRGYADGRVVVDVDGVLHRIPHDRIAKAHLEYDVEADLHRKD